MELMYVLVGVVIRLRNILLKLFCNKCFVKCLKWVIWIGVKGRNKGMELWNFVFEFVWVYIDFVIVFWISYFK